MADGQLSTAQRLTNNRLEHGSGSLPNCLAWLSQHALPEPGAEAWKYSPINRFYDTLLDTTQATALAGTRIEGLGKQQHSTVEVQHYQRGDNANLELPQELTERFTRAIDASRYPIAHAVGSDLHEVIVIQVSAPLTEALVLNQPAQGNRWVHIELLANTEATVIERLADASGGSMTTIELGAGAKLTHACSHQTTTQTSWRLNSINLADHASYELNQISLGGRLQRIDNHIRLSGAGAHASLVGCALCDGDNRADLQNVIEHIAAQCSSQQRYHGVVNQSGNLTFGGRIHIHEKAQGTSAHLTNKNMTLDNRAQINTKPELEIYNDDVSCSHGATIGRLDEEALFYLRSRGIDEHSAQSLLLAAFVKDAIGGPDADSMQEIIAEKLTLWTTAT